MKNIEISLYNNVPDQIKLRENVIHLKRTLNSSVETILLFS
jgi:hypothetical protein